MSSVHDVAIIGYGPVGATMANLLAKFGLQTLVIEKEAEIYGLPRAVHFDDEVMRTFQFAGLANDLRKVVRINPGTRFVGEEEELLLDWPRPEGLTGQGWNSSFRFHQPDLERILREHVTASDCVEVHLNHVVVAINQTEDLVVLEVADATNGKKKSFNARYVIGCDGARSFVRKTMQAGMDDLGFRERWLVVDVLLNVPRPDLGDHSIQYCSRSQPATYVRCPDDRRRWEMALQEDWKDIDPNDKDAVWQKLSRWITPGEGELERSAVYEFRSSVASSWRDNRLFLAGDAAHQMPPFMGQGMCAGIRDTINLAWKLNAVLRGNAGDQLLDSYQMERSPHVRAYVEMAVRLGKLINASNTKDALEAAFPQADGTAKLKSLAPRLETGPGIRDDDWGGVLSNQLPIGGNALGDDVSGPVPVLVMRDEVDQTQITNQFDGYTLRVGSSDEAAAYLDELSACALLIRPDRYIFGGATTPDQIPDLLHHWQNFVSN